MKKKDEDFKECSFKGNISHRILRQLFFNHDAATPHYLFLQVVCPLLLWFHFKLVNNLCFVLTFIKLESVDRG